MSDSMWPPMCAETQREFLKRKGKFQYDILATFGKIKKRDSGAN